MKHVLRKAAMTAALSAGLVICSTSAAVAEGEIKTAVCTDPILGFTTAQATCSSNFRFEMEMHASCGNSGITAFDSTVPGQTYLTLYLECFDAANISNVSLPRVYFL
jgi:hypothetical protein